MVWFWQILDFLWFFLDYGTFRQKDAILVKSEGGHPRIQRLRSPWPSLVSSRKHAHWGTKTDTKIRVRQQSGEMELVTSNPETVSLRSWNQHNSLISTRFSIASENKNLKAKAQLYWWIIKNFKCSLTFKISKKYRFSRYFSPRIYMVRSKVPHYWGGLVLWLKHADLLGHPRVFDWWSDLFLLNHNRSENRNATG